MSYHHYDVNQCVFRATVNLSVLVFFLLSFKKKEDVCSFVSHCESVRKSLNVLNMVLNLKSECKKS